MPSYDISGHYVFGEKVRLRGSISLIFNPGVSRVVLHGTLDTLFSGEAGRVEGMAFDNDDELEQRTTLSFLRFTREVTELYSVSSNNREPDMSGKYVGDVYFLGGDESEYPGEIEEVIDKLLQIIATSHESYPAEINLARVRGMAGTSPVPDMRQEQPEFSHVVYSSVE